MNLILIDNKELSGPTITLSDRRFRHIKKVLRGQPGDTLKIGVINGPLGTGRLLSIDKKEAVLQITLAQPPTAPPATDLILAVPRPIMLKRVLAQAVSLGVKNIYLIKTNRVEKSFFNASLLDRENINNCLLAGLEQCGVDTRLPKISIHKRFLPFIEDLLPAIVETTPTRLIAHPRTALTLAEQGRIGAKTRVIMAIGPEGGWVDFEIDKFSALGFTPFTLGPRILRVDTAVPALLSQIDLLRQIQGE